MLVAGAIELRRVHRAAQQLPDGRPAPRMVTSVREVNGVDGRVLSSEVFAETPDGRRAAAPISCLDDLVASGYRA